MPSIMSSTGMLELSLLPKSVQGGPRLTSLRVHPDRAQATEATSRTFTLPSGRCPWIQAIGAIHQSTHYWLICKFPGGHRWTPGRATADKLRQSYGWLPRPDRAYATRKPVVCLYLREHNGDCDVMCFPQPGPRQSLCGSPKLLAAPRPAPRGAAPKTLSQKRGRRTRGPRGREGHMWGGLERRSWRRIWVIRPLRPNQRHRWDRDARVERWIWCPEGRGRSTGHRVAAGDSRPSIPFATEHAIVGVAQRELMRWRSWGRGPQVGSSRVEELAAIKVRKVRTVQTVRNVLWFCTRGFRPPFWLKVFGAAPRGAGLGAANNVGLPHRLWRGPGW